MHAFGIVLGLGLLSSVASAVQITLYSDYNLYGQQQTYQPRSGGCWNTPQPWQQRTRSLQVQDGECYLYHNDYNCGGEPTVTSFEPNVDYPIYSFRCYDFE